MENIAIYLDHIEDVVQLLYSLNDLALKHSSSPKALKSLLEMTTEQLEILLAGVNLIQAEVSEHV